MRWRRANAAELSLYSPPERVSPCMAPPPRRVNSQQCVATYEIAPAAQAAAGGATVARLWLAARASATKPQAFISSTKASR